MGRNLLDLVSRDDYASFAESTRRLLAGDEPSQVSRRKPEQAPIDLAALARESRASLEDLHGQVALVVTALRSATGC